MNTDRKRWTLIQRYVTGNATPDEQQMLESWMKESNENRRVVQELKKVWDETPAEEFEVNVQYAWEQFRFRNQKNERQPSLAVVHAHRKPGVLNYFIKVAAVFLVSLIAGLFVYNQMNTTEQGDSEQVSAIRVLEKLETGNGEKARVTFSDGTRMTMNSASSIRFPKEFHGSTREVYLEGEAYFEVAHNPGQPFIVHVQDARIEVLGTEFNVRGWSEDLSVEVVVKDGKVSVQPSNQSTDDNSEVILTKGLRTQVKRGQNPIEPHKVDLVRHLLWTSGGMHFDNAPFHQVVRELERRFNVNIEVSDVSILDVPYTGTFQYAELNEVLSVIAASMEIGYRREGGEVEFFE